MAYACMQLAQEDPLAMAPLMSITMIIDSVATVWLASGPRSGAKQEHAWMLD